MGGCEIARLANVSAPVQPSLPYAPRNAPGHDGDHENACTARRRRVFPTHAEALGDGEEQAARDPDVAEDFGAGGEDVGEDDVGEGNGRVERGEDGPSQRPATRDEHERGRVS